MKKKILFIDSQTKNLCALSTLLNELETRDFEFIIFSPCAKFYNEERNQEWHNKKLPQLFNLNITWQLIFFIILSPIFILASFFLLLYIKFSKKINTIICSHYLEKICFTKISRLLKINLIWLEFPDTVNEKRNKTLTWLLKNHSRFTRVICFTNNSKDLLAKQGYKLENISVIAPGIKQKNLQRQENIFEQIAQNDKSLKKRKFFTIGIVTELNNEKIGDKLEKLFQAVKKSLVVVPHIQLIIVGEGGERKNLGWLTKRMEIDNLIWFVGGPNLPEAGSQKHLKKWLDSFDLLISVCDNIDLNDLHVMLHAMATELPIIAPEYIGFETIIENKKNGSLINTDNSDNIAQEIIDLQQSKTRRQEYGKSANEAVQNYFTISRIADQLELILR